MNAGFPTRYRLTNSSPWLGVIALLLASGTGMALPLAPQPSQRWLLLLGSTIVLIITLVIAKRRPNPSLLDPIYLSVLVFALLFVMRPASDLLHGTLVWVAKDISDVYTTILIAALLATVGYFLGLLSSASRLVSSKFSPPPTSFIPERMLVFGFLLLGTGMLARLGSTYIATGTISAVLDRREDVASTGANIPILSEAILVIVPAFLIFLQAFRIFPVPSSIGIAGCSLVAVLSVFNGDRRYTLVLVSCAVAFYLLRGGGRPRMYRLALGMLALYFLLIAPVEITRGSQTTYLEAVSTAVKSPTVVAENLLLESQSASMLAAFGTLVQTMDDPGNSTRRYGMSILTETLLQPIPRQLWNSKPLPIRTIVIQKLWGFEDGRCTGLCPTFSALAPFYSDFGMLGVLFGSFFLGVMVRVPYALYQRFPNNFYTQAAAASFVLVPLFVWWGSLGSIVVAAGATLLPLFLIAKTSP